MKIELTTIQAAAILRVTPSRVQQLAIAGRIKGVKVGRDWRFEASSVKAHKPAKRGPKPVKAGH